MANETSTPSYNLTQRGKQLRAVVLFSSAIALSGLGYRAATSGPEYPTCIQTTEFTVPEGGTLWRAAESIVPDVDPREVIDAIKHFSGLTTNTIQVGQTLQIPTPDTIHCNQ